MTTNNQIDHITTGGTAYRIDEADGAITAKAYDRIYVEVDVILTTLTGSDDSNLLTAMNITSDVNVISAGMILGAGQGKTIKAVTVKSGDAGVIWGLSKGTTNV